jgi:hypothetical protein
LIERQVFQAIETSLLKKSRRKAHVGEVIEADGFVDLDESRSPTSRITIANKKLAETPHIRIPVTLSTGPIVRQRLGRTRSPQLAVE